MPPVVLLAVAALAGEMPARFPHAKLYLLGVNVANDYRPPTELSERAMDAGMLLAPGATPLRVARRTVSAPLPNGSEAIDDYFDLLLDGPRGAQLVKSLYLDGTVHGFSSAAVSVDRTFVAGSLTLDNSNYGENAWVWDEAGGYQYLNLDWNSALAGSAGIDAALLTGFMPQDVAAMSPDGRWLGGFARLMPWVSNLGGTNYYLDLGPRATPTPEPSTLAAWGLAGAFAAALRRRRREPRADRIP